MDKNSLLPVFTAFGGIILGAISSIFPAYVLERLKRKGEVEAVTNAIVTEIRVTLFLAEKRKYVKNIEAVLNSLRAGEIPSATFQIIVPDEHCPIFRSHLNRIGFIPSEIRDDIVTFYQLYEAAICDVREGGLIATTECGLAEFTQLHEIATEAIRVGRKVLDAHPTKGENMVA